MNTPASQTSGGNNTANARPEDNRLTPQSAAGMPLSRPPAEPASEAAAGSSLWGAVGDSLKLHREAPPLVPVARDRSLPLSFAQQRLWFIQQADPANAAYNLAFAWRLSGPLQVAALEQSLNALEERHENLRTNFVSQEGRPVQIIAPSRAVALPVVALEHGPAAEREAQALRRLAQEAQKPFDLAQAPLLRPLLVRLEEQQHLLLLVLHHIICDGASLSVVFHELQASYQAFSTGQPVSLPALPIQYADFAVWQRDWLRDSVLENQLAYWKQQLGGRLPVLELPADQTRPARRSFRGACHYFSLSAPLADSLRAFRKQEATTLFHALLAAFNALLYRYTGQENLMVGVPVANRTHPEFRQLIGFFINILVLRTAVDGCLSFRQLLQRVKQASLAAYAHQDVPFERLVEELKPERDLSHTPLFQVMFSFQGQPRRDLELPGLRVRRVEVDTGTSKFDLTLDIRETAEGIAGFFEYSTDLFEAATIRRLADHWQILLAAAMAHPDQPLDSLPMLSEAERRQLLVEWNDTRSACPKETCLHELFEAQAARTPESVALVAGTQRLTYAELNAHANQLAHFLRSLQVGPEVLVGLCVERSAAMVVGLLAILKAGGAYVPLDPAYPKDRLAFTLQDAKVPVLLTQSSLLEPCFGAGAAGQSAAGHTPKVVCLDKDWKMIARESAANPPASARPANLAYVLYTSGSTGRPKGVAIEHRSPVAFAAWARKVFTPEELAGVLFSTSICFDLSIFELFVTLAWGGKVILAENALQLPAVPAGREVTLVNTVPSAMAQLVRTDGLPPSVRTVNLAGEPLPTSLVDQIYQTSHVHKVYDLYGPTEDTTYSTFTLRKPGEPATIGRPLANKQLYVLNPHGQPVPVGVPGELHIAGLGLARGYLNRPELTAEKFIPNPFSPEPGERLYKTGDLVRYRPNGNLEFLGRIDHQVKVHGFRIELGEIESVLRQHPHVRDTVVAAQEAPSGDQRLVAYCSPAQSPAPAAEELRCFLKTTLPDYMVPAVFVMLDLLPRTPNGKVDRKALPIPDAAAAPGECVAPTTPMQLAIAQIWSDVLGLKRVGLHDNFFTLGGHSLIATQVISRLRSFSRTEVMLRDLFESPTLAGLAATIEQRQAAGTAPAQPALVALARKRPQPLGH